MTLRPATVSWFAIGAAVEQWCGELGFVESLAAPAVSVG